MPLRILVVDDHDVVRQGVRLILNARADWEICGEAENGTEALRKEKELRPDIIVLDVTMPGKDGLEVAAELRSRKSPSKIVVLTMHDSRELAAAVKEVGAKGYVVKSHAAQDLITAIESVSGGADFFSSHSLAAKKDLSTKKRPTFRLTLLPAFAFAVS
jgi:two-component system, NarL family, response regulator NreC